MVATRTLDGELVDEIAEIAREASCELLHCEYRGGTLRVFLDRPEGVTLSDCETVSKQVSALLDVSDFGLGRYTLEVSSPGLDRQLFSPRDFERFCGRLVRVTFTDRSEAERAAKKTLVGRLEAFHPDSGTDGSAGVETGRSDPGSSDAGTSDSGTSAPATSAPTTSTAAGIRVTEVSTGKDYEIELRDIRLARLEIEL